MRATNILVSSTRQWNPGDEFILSGVQRLCQEWLPFPINWLLYDRNPDFMVNGWRDPRPREDLWSNVFRHEDLSSLDFAIIAGTPEWFGAPLQRFYAAIREYETPLLLLGVGYVDRPVEFSDDETYCLQNLTRAVTTRDEYASTALAALDVSHQVLPDPALFAADREYYPDQARRLAFVLQSDETVNQAVSSKLAYAGWHAALAAQARGHEVDIVCFYVDEAVRFLRQQPLPVRYSYNAQDYLALLAEYDVIVSTRLHGAIVANSLGKPAILFNPDPRCLGAASLFPFIYVTEPQGIGDRLAQIDLGQVRDELPRWKAQIREQYLTVLRGVVRADDVVRLEHNRLRVKMWLAKATLRKREQELAAERARVSALRSELASLHEHVEEGAKYARSLQEYLDSQKEYASALKTEMDSLQQTLAERDRQIQECDRQIRERDRLIQERDHEIQAITSRRLYRWGERLALLLRRLRRR